jgi:hypothetical protein
MDKMNETINSEQLEYEAPAIVDYGDLVAMTAANGEPRLTDVPDRSPIAFS